MSCPACINALAGVDGYSPPSPNKTTAIGAAIGGVLGLAIVPKNRAAGLIVGAVAGYLLAPMIADRVGVRSTSSAVQQAAVLPPAQKTPATVVQPPPPQVPPSGGRPPITSTDTTRILPSTTTAPPPEVAPSETDVFLDEWMKAPEGPMEF